VACGLGGGVLILPELSLKKCLYLPKNGYLSIASDSMNVVSDSHNFKTQALKIK